MTVSRTHVQRLIWTCLYKQAVAKTIVQFFFIVFALVEVVLGFQDTCNCLVLSGFLHFCHVIDLETYSLPQHYPSQREAPKGFLRFHLLIRLANLCMMIFLCMNCIAEAFCDFPKDTDIQPTTVPLILVISVVLHFLSTSLHRTGSQDVADSGLSTSPWSRNDGGGGNVPAKVGFVAFLSFAVIQYLIHHDKPLRWVDSGVTLVAATAAIVRVAPSVQNYALLFMQASSRLKRGVAAGCLQQIESLAGVIEYHSERFWVFVPGQYVASVCIRIQVKLSS